MRYFLRLSYNGTGFHGWQRQANAHSVQAELEGNLARILGTATALTGCGRTDTGVHAREFYAHFDADRLGQSEQKLRYRLNLMASRNIAVREVLRVHDEAHARFDATQRTYEYMITPEKNPFLIEFAYRYGSDLDLGRMNKACGLLLGEQDFGCFRKARSNNGTNICNVREAAWTEDGQVVLFNITADRFLRNMVRAIVGTMLDIGQGSTSIDDLEAILASGKRTEAGRSVPAHGLYLTRVEYPPTIFHPGP